MCSKQCWGSMTFWYVSGLPRVLLFIGTFTSVFQRGKVIRKSLNSRNQGFSYVFCLVMERSGSVQIMADPNPEGPKTCWSRSIKLALSATIGTGTMKCIVTRGMGKSLDPSCMVWSVEGLNCKRPIPICRLFFKIYLLTDIAALCLTNFIDWRYIHILVGIFDPACELLPPWTKELYLCSPSIFSLTSSPLPKLNVQFIQTVCVWGGGGVNCTV